MLGLSHDCLFSLQVLELRGNKINTTAGLGVSKLKKLYLVRDHQPGEWDRAAADPSTCSPGSIKGVAMNQESQRSPC